jgi:hypothetical protein
MTLMPWARQHGPPLLENGGHGLIEVNNISCRLVSCGLTYVGIAKVVFARSKKKSHSVASDPPESINPQLLTANRHRFTAAQKLQQRRGNLK